MSEFAWDPQTYAAMMSADVPAYPQLQIELTAQIAAFSPESILDLGIGSGLTAHRIAEAIPSAHITGLDSSAEMLSAAEEQLDPARTTLIRSRLEDSLPPGPFEVVTSTLAIHHLDGPGKADLFSRIAEVLTPGAHFVLADLVVPLDPADVVTEIDGVMDTPSTLADQLEWLEQAGLSPRVHWVDRDLAVVVAEKVAERTD